MAVPDEADLGKSTPMSAPYYEGVRAGLDFRDGEISKLRKDRQDQAQALDELVNVTEDLWVKALEAKLADAEAALERIDRVSTGEDQLEDEEALDDTETLGWIHRFIQAARGTNEQMIPRELTKEEYAHILIALPHDKAVVLANHIAALEQKIERQGYKLKHIEAAVNYQSEDDKTVAARGEMGE